MSGNMCVNPFHRGSRDSPRHTTASAAPGASTVLVSNHPLLVPHHPKHVGHSCPEAGDAQAVDNILPMVEGLGVPVLLQYS